MVCQVSDRNGRESEDSAAGVRGTFQVCLVNDCSWDCGWSGSQLGPASSRGEVTHACGLEMCERGRDTVAAAFVPPPPPLVISAFIEFS